ncbi:glycoside hydrolase family 43 protein [Hymenobacter weizhouensis]|uniref:glycoside hydrolase family 43 protein n=1 Tax=Hymenobacter sp. YIM 151500-1 TaxID=2987689 RepID=UPI002226798B|nr:glycoside hydrolase family 43 protein [Hymenobacter sp. YIM 151500-1]UYZ62096.1 glycoside hydrolase family 43 protein [Hymenobacter sp. YIM 151500-1]
MASTTAYSFVTRRVVGWLRVVLVGLGLTWTSAQAQPAPPAATFTNPLLPSGADPWSIHHNGYYYYTHTTGRNITLWKTKSLSQLATAPSTVVWTPPATGPNSRDIWAPELHFLNGKWYLYYAADAGTNQTHRLWVLENSAADPTTGTWVDKGQLTDATNKWAIDGSVFESGGQQYLVWSGWEGDVNGRQDIYLARLKNPWTVEGPRVKISTPVYFWERDGDLNDPQNPPHVDVNEGPQVLRHAGKLYLIYSASGCWTDSYTLGMLTATEGTDLMQPGAWAKSPVPVFRQDTGAGVYAPGHNSFFKSPDGTQDWILYHANSQAGQGCGRFRSPRAQPFTWNADGTPNFGRPVPAGQPLPRPSGE